MFNVYIRQKNLFLLMQFFNFQIGILRKKVEKRRVKISKVSERFVSNMFLILYYSECRY